MALRYSMPSILILALACQANALNLRTSTSDQDDATVCVSVSAYEDQEYIDALIQNFLHFTESSTKLSLHLDKSSNYEHPHQRWNSDRITVVPNSMRIDVKPFSGSIIYSHMSNVRTMENVWPGQCKYWVLQASNMMWVRSGMEAHVRENQFSPLGPSTSEDRKRGCAFVDHKPKTSNTFLSFSDKLFSRREVYGWGQPEGSFFPFSVVQNFDRMMTEHLKEVHDNGSGISDAACYFENVWLQTYALNWENVPDGPEFQEKREKMTPLCRNYITYGDKENDSVPMEELEKVLKGSDEKGPGAATYEYYFAVKRVNRNVNHPTTKFIIDLAK